jgi:hypothetical protein
MVNLSLSPSGLWQHLPCSRRFTTKLYSSGERPESVAPSKLPRALFCWSACSESGTLISHNSRF